MLHRTAAVNRPAVNRRRKYPQEGGAPDSRISPQRSRLRHNCITTRKAA
jgi:hypothetical protein